MAKKYKIGDKVVPISKSVGVSLHEDDQWQLAKKNDQDYLYIVRVEEGRFDYACAYENSTDYGNHYLESDLKLFGEDEKEDTSIIISAKTLLWLINKGIIKENDMLKIDLA